MKQQLPIELSLPLRTASITGAALLMMAVSANAGTISYTTNSPLTDFIAGINSLTWDSTGGQAATLIFAPNTSSTSGVPSDIDPGHFILSCASCTTTQSTFFGAFTFDLVVDDTTDGATGEFVDTSTGGTVSINSSTILFSWQSLLSIGPGRNNSLSGNFGTTAFDVVSPASRIVAADSGISPGNTTIQGQVSYIAEPATDSVIGGALLGLGFLLRKNFLRR
jgi:hypothetical protein